MSSSPSRTRTLGTAKFAKTRSRIPVVEPEPVVPRNLPKIYAAEQQGLRGGTDKIYRLAPSSSPWDAKTPVEPRRPNPVDRHDLLHGYAKYFLEDAKFFTLNAKTDSMARTRQDLRDDKIYTDPGGPDVPRRHNQVLLPGCDKTYLRYPRPSPSNPEP